MEVFLERIHQLMPVLGADALVPIGHLTPTGFVVLEGSQAVLKERASAHSYPYILAIRKKLIQDGTLIRNGEHYKFTRDSEFSSPSAAASVVHGGSANGLLAWKSKGGKALKELEAI